jgi:hypothetical protein
MPGRRRIRLPLSTTTLALAAIAIGSLLWKTDYDRARVGTSGPVLAEQWVRGGATYSEVFDHPGSRIEIRGFAEKGKHRYVVGKFNCIVNGMDKGQLVLLYKRDAQGGWYVAERGTIFHWYSFL